MRNEFYFDSCGSGRIHVCKWEPEGAPIAVVQIIHGIAEYAARYDHFAKYLNRLGYLVVAEDHMGHGGSVGAGQTKGYFSGGWFSAVGDTYQLYVQTKAEYPELPYFLLGHSMGSFMARTILQKYPEADVAGCILSGTGWQPTVVLRSGIAMCETMCKLFGAKEPNPSLQKLLFGPYNKRVEHPRTPYDWLSRSNVAVDAYVSDPMCGFTATSGLFRDMLTGIAYIQQQSNLEAMNKELPVFFVAGGDDPVGDYGKGVAKTAQAFQKAGMQKVDLRIYPLCRHEILNEINKETIYADIAKWLEGCIDNKS